MHSATYQTYLTYPTHPAYEFRRTTAGSIRIARRDGIHVASAPIAVTIATGTTNDGQSGS